MATYAMTPKRWKPHPWLALPILLLTAAAGWMLIENMHSYFRHRNDSQQAYNCFRQHGPFAVWRAPNNKKEMVYHFLCQDDGGSFFDVIMGKDGSPRTAFRLDDARSVQDALRYIQTKIGSTHVPWERIPEALMRAIEPYLPAGFLGGQL